MTERSYICEATEVLEARTRTVYVTELWVYKVATSEEGFQGNYMESRLYRDNLAHPEAVFIPIAECYLLDDGVLKMRRIQRFPVREELPTWTGYVDCAQVGYIDGELVAYDL